jgi:hypothetical protein
MRQVEKLPKEFEGTGEVKGMTFTIMLESSIAYLYRVTNSEGFQHYEVIKKMAVPVCLDFSERKYSDTLFKEVYPKSNSFGTTGWTYRRFEMAKAKFMSILINFK